MSDIDKRIFDMRERLRQIRGLYKGEEVRPNMFDDAEFLLDMLELKESEYQSAVDKCNKSSQIAREYQEENRRLRADLNIRSRQLKMRDMMLKSSQQRAQKLIEGLRFYAPSKNYQPPKPFYIPVVVADEGDIARRILDEIGVREDA